MKNIYFVTYVGIFLLAIVTVNLLIHIAYEGGDLGEVFWYCNIATIMLGVGFLFRRAGLITAVFVTAIPVQFFWIVDFFLNSFGLGMGRTAWLFNDSLFFLTPIISIILHGILIPLSLWGVFKYGFDKRAYYWVIAAVFILLLATFFFTSPEFNRNCVFYPCDLNYVQHLDTITSHTYYRTWIYAGQVILWWLTVVSVLFVACGRVFKKFV